MSLNGNLLSVKGQREEEHHEQGESYYTSERTYGSFARTFTLPDGLDSEQVDADLKDGVLTVRIPSDGPRRRRSESPSAVRGRRQREAATAERKSVTALMPRGRAPAVVSAGAQPRYAQRLLANGRGSVS